MKFHEEVSAIYKKILPYIRHTPLIRSEYFSSQLGCNIFFKLENMQITGSFKPRGVFTKILSLSKEDIESGFITASGGNHGLAVCYAASMSHTKARVYLPENTPEYKREKIRAADGEVVIYGAVWDDANEYAMKVAVQEGKTYIHPFDDEQVIRGQATMAHEIFIDNPEIDTIMCSIGGGGMISGISAYTKSFKPSAHVYGVETKGTDSMYQSIQAGHIVELPGITSIAESLGAKKVTQRTFEYVQKNVDQLFVVQDSEAIEDLVAILQEEKQLTEPAASCVLSACRQNNRGKNVAIVLCGGNLPVDSLKTFIP